MTIIQTERLQLRHIELDKDAASIIELLNDEAWLENIGERNVRNVAAANKYISSMLESYQMHGFGSYVVELKESKTFIGTCGLFVREHLDHPDIGYALLPAFRRQGYALEAANAVMLYAKNEFQIKKILAFTKAENEPSKNLLIHLGMNYIGKIPYKDGVLDDLFSIEL